MLQLKDLLPSLHKKVSGLQLRFFLALRFIFSVVLIGSAVERLLDAEFVRRTSFAYAHIFPSDLHRWLRFFYESSWAFSSFLMIFSLIVLIYACGFGGRWILVLAGLAEFCFQHLTAGNVYGHEGFIHQFFILLLVYEFCLGRQRRGQLVNPTNSFGAGLAVVLLRWQLAVLYFCAGLSKLFSPAWNQDDFLSLLVRRPLYGFSEAYLVVRTVDFLSPFLQFAVPWLQMSLPLLLFFSKTRRLGILLGLSFHLFLAVLMQIYWFSFFMVGLYLVFYSARRKSQNNPSAPSI